MSGPDQLVTYRFRAFGARHTLGQLTRIEDGFRALGWVEAGDNDPNVDLIYANDEPRWQEAIEYRDRVQPKAKLILCVLDLGEWNWGRGFNPNALIDRLKKADSIVCISQYVAGQLARYYGLNVPVIYNPLKSVSPEKRRAGIRDYPYRYLMAGRMSDPNKRANLAIQALTLAGANEEEVAVIGGDNVGFGVNLGVVSDYVLDSLLNSVDFVVSCSLGAGLELPPLEGLVCGAVPVVCSDLTTFPEFYPSSWGCFPNPHSIAYRIRTLIDNPSLLASDRAYCLEYGSKLKEMLSGRAVAERIVNVFIDLTHS